MRAMFVEERTGRHASQDSPGNTKGGQKQNVVPARPETG